MGTGVLVRTKRQKAIPWVLEPIPVPFVTSTLLLAIGSTMSNPHNSTLQKFLFFSLLALERVVVGDNSTHHRAPYLLKVVTRKDKDLRAYKYRQCFSRKVSTRP